MFTICRKNMVFSLKKWFLLASIIKWLCCVLIQISWIYWLSSLYCKLQHNSTAKYTNLRFLYTRKCQYRMSDGYKFTHIIKIKIIWRVRILWIIRTQVRINQRIRTHSFWVRILLGTNSPGYEISWYRLLYTYLGLIFHFTVFKN